MQKPILARAKGALRSLKRRVSKPRTPARSKPQSVVTSQSPDEFAVTRHQRDWFRYFYSQYVSMERLRQYGIADKRTRIYAGAVHEFTQVDEILERVIVPPSSEGPLDQEPIYFGCRVCFLRQPDGSRKMYSISYVGSASWTHGKEPFDAIFDVPEPDGYLQPAGFLASIMRDHGKAAFLRHGHMAPISINVADTTGDGADDFYLCGRLVHSSPAGYVLSDDATLVGREVFFLRHAGKVWTLSPGRDVIEVYDPANPSKSPVRTLPLDGAMSVDRPLRVLPVDEKCSPDGKARFIALTDNSIDFYVIEPDWTARKHLSLTGVAPWEIFIGAVGNFSGADVADFWVSESRWKNADGATVGRLSLIEGRRLSEGGTHHISDFARTTIEGSARYTDYDGIGATLSPIAGDFDGDGIPDFSFSGHRHMSEAGAFFVLPGSAIRPGRMTVEDSAILKIVGRPVCQLAPYFHHLDIEGRVVVAADNDIAAGINAGSIYVMKIPGKA